MELSCLTPSAALLSTACQVECKTLNALLQAYSLHWIHSVSSISDGTFATWPRILRHYGWLSRGGGLCHNEIGWRTERRRRFLTLLVNDNWQLNSHRGTVHFFESNSLENPPRQDSALKYCFWKSTQPMDFRLYEVEWILKWDQLPMLHNPHTHGLLSLNSCHECLIRSLEILIHRHSQTITFSMQPPLGDHVRACETNQAYLLCLFQLEISE